MKTSNQKEFPKIPPEHPVPHPESPPIVIPQTPKPNPEIIPVPETPTTKPLPPDHPPAKPK